MSSELRIGEHRFDPESGELRHSGAGSKTVRLKPQPARLLALLIEKDGELLSRDEIRQGLWPDVEIEFDPSLHFCVHQLRSALRQAAGPAITIETLPRRGYRLKAPPVASSPSPSEVPLPDEPSAEGAPAEELGTSRDPASRPSRPSASRRPAAALLAFAALALVAWVALRQPETSTVPAPRLAVMSFQPADGLTVVGRPWEIAEHVLLDLGNLGPEILAVLGPATTAPYSSELPELWRLEKDFELDFILNGRFIAPEEPQDPWPLVVELIRTSDHAHLWVSLYGDCSDPQSLAREVASAVRQELGLESLR